MKIEICSDERILAVARKRNQLEALLNKAFHQSMKSVKISKDQAAVLYLIENYELSQKEIAERLCISEATLSVRVKRLERDGYIERIIDQHDKRRYQLILTQKGKDIINDAVMRVNETINKTFAGVSTEDLEGISHFLDKLIENLHDFKGEDYD